jgi:uncharacterized MnhB-related membrane protein
VSVLASIAPVQGVLVVLAAGAATAVALTRNPLRQLVVNGVYSLILSLTFFVFQAPDVALSMLVVGAIAYPFVVLAAISRSRVPVAGEGQEPDEGGE